MTSAFRARDRSGRGVERDDRVVLCHHDVEVFDDANPDLTFRYSQRHRLLGGSVRDVLRVPAFCAGASVMVRASALPAGGFDPRVRVSSDWLLYLRTLLSRGLDNPGAHFIPEVLVRYRRHADNVTVAPRTTDLGNDGGHRHSRPHAPELAGSSGEFARSASSRMRFGACCAATCRAARAPRCAP